MTQRNMNEKMGNGDAVSDTDFRHKAVENRRFCFFVVVDVVTHSN